MEAKKLTIEDLLNSLKSPNETAKPILINSKNTWSRIGNGDSFSELELENNNLSDFLKEWIKDNPYSNL